MAGKRNTSIKVRLTALYAVFMILLICAALGILFSLSNQEVLSSVQSELEKQVQESGEDIRGDGEKLKVDSDFYTMENGVYLSLYDPDGSFLYGRIPSGFSRIPDLKSESMRTVKGERESWYVYDMRHEIPKYGEVFVRGIVSVTKAENSLRITLRFALIMLPALAVIMIFLAYRFVRRALLPVKNMTDTVLDIQKDGKLSRRVGLSGGRDEIHRLAETFDRMLDGMEEAFERERQFTSDVSHELRTPAAVILLQCEELLRSRELTKSQEIQVSNIHRKAEEMSRMISQLLLLSRADQGRAVLQKERLDISELTELAVEEQEAIAEEKGIEIRGEIEKGIQMEVDESFFIRLLENLISNSISYGKEGGTTRVLLRESEQEITLTVADDGIGIAPEHLPRIWDRFFRADVSRSDSSHSGLGLSMVKWIAEEHGGRVDVTSRPGEGSTFTCTFTKQ